MSTLQVQPKSTSVKLKGLKLRTGVVQRMRSLRLVSYDLFTIPLPPLYHHFTITLTTLYHLSTLWVSLDVECG